MPLNDSVPQEANANDMRLALVSAYGALVYMQAYPEQRDTNRTIAELLKIIEPVVPAHVVEACKTMVVDFR